MNEILKVTKVGEERKDKNDKIFKVVTFETLSAKQEFTAVGTLTVKMKTKKSSRSFWKHNYMEVSLVASKLNKDIVNLKDKDIEEIDCDFGYDLKVGDHVAGDVVTREVVAYEIPDRITGEMKEVNSYTRVIFGETSKLSFEHEVRREFVLQDRSIIQRNESLVMKTVEEQVEVEASI